VFGHVHIRRDGRKEFKILGAETLKLRAQNKLRRIGIIADNADNSLFIVCSVKAIRTDARIS